MQKVEDMNTNYNSTIETMQSLPQVGFMMAVFNIVYCLWFGFAWGTIGWVVFGLLCFVSIAIIFVSILSLKHSKSFAKVASK